MAVALQSLSPATINTVLKFYDLAIKISLPCIKVSELINSSVNFSEILF